LQSENETSGKIKLHIAEVLVDHDKIGANKKGLSGTHTSQQIENTNDTQ
jgi:hypothetical protein